MPAFSLDLRKRILDACLDTTATQADVARRFSVSLGFTREAPATVPHHRFDRAPAAPRQSSCALDRRRPAPCPLAGRSERRYARGTCPALRARNRTQDQWPECAPGAATKRHHAKKKTLHASERHRADVAAERAAFLANQAELPLAQLVFVDESGVNRAMTRRYGRAPRRERAVGDVPSSYGKNTTLLGAMTLNGPVALRRVVGGGTTNAVFAAFVEQVLCPILKPGQIVLLDNLTAHKQACVRAMIEVRGARLVHLPRYSPELNPIEKLWSKMKAKLRAWKARTQPALEEAVDRALALVSAVDAQAWCHHAGYRLTNH